jgi:hypothetical protein
MQGPTDKSRRKKSEQQEENQNISDAHKQAEKDIEKDPDLSSKPDPGDDLDEGELARLEGGQ